MKMSGDSSSTRWRLCHVVHSGATWQDVVCRRVSVDIGAVGFVLRLQKSAGSKSEKSSALGVDDDGGEVSAAAID